MLPKKHLSGAQKRKKKKQEDEFSWKSIDWFVLCVININV
jgi:hypothetical protein